MHRKRLPGNDLSQSRVEHTSQLSFFADWPRQRSIRVVPLPPRTFHLLKHAIILGARAPACLEWARAFSRASWRVTVEDSLRWPLARSSDFAHAFLRLLEPRRDPRGWVKALFKAIRSAKIDEVLPTCEEVFYQAHGLSKLREVCRGFASASSSPDIGRFGWA